MSLKEAQKKFLKMEEKFDLFNQKIDNAFFWEKIRMFVFDQIFFEGIFTSNQTVKRRSYNIIDIFSLGIRSLKSIIFMNPYFSSQKEIIFLGHPGRRLQEDGKWWDVYCDPIIDNLDRSYILIEYYRNFSHFTPPKTRNIRYLDFFAFLFVIQKFLRLKRVSFSRREKILLKNIQNEIKKTFGIETNLLEITKKNLLLRKTYLPLFIRLIRRIKPRLVILVISYNAVNEALIEAGKKMRIPVIELQHGVINPYHFAYFYHGHKRKKRSFVDYLFTFGEYWKNSMEYPIKKEKILSVGFPYLEKEYKKYKKISKKDQILFISGGPISKALSKFAVEFSKKNRSNTKILYKLHPSEYPFWKRNYPWLLKSDIQVIDNNDIPFYRLLAESRVLIGVSSTAIYEGLIFRVKIYLINMPGIEYMDYLIESGAVKLISSVDELEKDLIKNSYGRKIDTEIFFRNNALQNIKKEINNIISLHSEYNLR